MWIRPHPTSASNTRVEHWATSVPFQLWEGNQPRFGRHVIWVNSKIMRIAVNATYTYVRSGGTSGHDVPSAVLPLLTQSGHLATHRTSYTSIMDSGGLPHTEAVMSSTPLTFVGIFVLLVFANAAAAQAADTDQTSKAERAEPRSERTTSEGCPDEAPLSCPGTDSCCASDTPNLCQSLTRNHPAGSVSAGWSGCVRPASDESWKFWSDACQPIWELCR
jgi:hypothetical protein